MAKDPQKPKPEKPIKDRPQTFDGPGGQNPPPPPPGPPPGGDPEPGG